MLAALEMGEPHFVVKVVRTLRGLRLIPAENDGNLSGLVCLMERSGSISPKMKTQRSLCRGGAVVDYRALESAGITSMRNFSDYQIEEYIGAGAFSFVYAGRLRGERQTIVCKSSRLTKEDNESLSREALILQHLSHPNIVRLLGAGKSEYNQVQIFLTHAPGYPLETLISKKLDEDIVWNVALQLADAIRYLHDQDIVHLDIKPRNIMVMVGSKIAAEVVLVTVIDFNQARSVQDKKTLTELAGSPLYAAPEILRREPYDGKKQDIWSFGAVIAEVILGKRLYGDPGNALQVRNYGGRMNALELYTKNTQDLLPQKSGVRDFINQACQFYPDCRPSIADLQATDPWLRGSFRTNK